MPRRPDTETAANGVPTGAVATAAPVESGGLRLPFDSRRFFTGLAIILVVGVCSTLGGAVWRAFGAASKDELRETVAPINRRIDKLEDAVGDVAAGVQRLEQAAGTRP